MSNQISKDCSSGLHEYCTSCEYSCHNEESLKKKLEDYEHSFELYHKASMSLMNAYKRAHPEVPENVWPDATQVNVWAAKLIEKL